MTNTKRVIVVPVGEAPRWGEIPGRNALSAMQDIVHGMIECVPLNDPACPGLDLWCNEEGMYNGSLVNRTFGATPRTRPPGFEDAVVIKTDDDLADEGQPGVWQIHGDFFLCRTDGEGETESATEADMAWAVATFRGVNPIAAAIHANWRASHRR